jgi:hypothetical protein
LIESILLFSKGKNALLSQRGGVSPTVIVEGQVEHFRNGSRVGWITRLSRPVAFYSGAYRLLFGENLSLELVKLAISSGSANST